MSLGPGLLYDLGLTNLMLARVRPVLSVRSEGYVKWWYGGAFNGAGLYCARELATVLFWQGPSRAARQGATYPASFGDVEVWADHDAAAVRAVVASCERDFPALVSDVARLKLVARFQLNLTFVPGAGGPAEHFRRLATTVATLAGGHLTLEAPRPIPPIEEGAWMGDLEMVLPSLTGDEALRARLAPFLQLEGQLFGLGAHCRAPDDPAVRGGQLTARHF